MGEDSHERHADVGAPRLVVDPHHLRHPAWLPMLRLLLPWLPTTGRPISGFGDRQRRHRPLECVQVERGHERWAGKGGCGRRAKLNLEKCVQCVLGVDQSVVSCVALRYRSAGVGVMFLCYSLEIEKLEAGALSGTHHATPPRSRINHSQLPSLTEITLEKQALLPARQHTNQSNPWLWRI